MGVRNSFLVLPVPNGSKYMLSIWLFTNIWVLLILETLQSCLISSFEMRCRHATYFSQWGAYGCDVFKYQVMVTPSAHLPRTPQNADNVEQSP